MDSKTAAKNDNLNASNDTLEQSRINLKDGNPPSELSTVPSRKQQSEVLKFRTTSLSIKQQAEQTMQQSCKEMIDSVVNYLNAELTGEDYKLLTAMNKMTAEKYKEMCSSTTTLVKKMAETNESYHSLHPYLSQIDLLEDSVEKLEKTAYKLDLYSKQLEGKFKRLEKK